MPRATWTGSLHLRLSQPRCPWQSGHSQAQSLQQRRSACETTYMQQSRYSADTPMPCLLQCQALHALGNGFSPTMSYRINELQSRAQAVRAALSLTTERLSKISLLAGTGFKLPWNLPARQQHMPVQGFAQQHGARAFQDILDIGCSAGISTRALAEAFPEAASLRGLDLSPHFLAVAEYRERWPPTLSLLLDFQGDRPLKMPSCLPPCWAALPLPCQVRGLYI
jgi:hypothetical protein